MLALDLCDPSTDADLAEPTTAGRWLRDHGLRADVTPDGLADLRALRDAVDSLLRSAVERTSPSPSALDRLNARSAAAAACLQLNWPSAGVPRMWLSTPGGPDASVLGAVARSAIELLSGRDRERLRVCGAHGCERLFIAATPRRQWCSPACGNRVRVARHAARYRLR
ncbi:MAG TPA: ABATE domain-containing protein [Gaiellales bacterium]|nr:ABATE domain-containing protein [Gaiellales bacterium]